jgi:asparagine synthase (glutamine-hydrolysing)
MVAARDPFGIKPLYVLSHPRGGVTLSSELGPLLLHHDARELSPVSLTQYLAIGHTGPTATLYQNITKLLPGRVYSWFREGQSQWRLHTGDLQAPFESELSTPVEALQDSVLAHLVSDVEVGAFLSSGVDSTLVCSLARPHLDRLRTFTVSFPEHPQIDESELAAQNAKQMGTTHETLKVSTGDLVKAVPAVIREHGEPLADAAALALCLLAKFASTKVKVVLTGEGADELFGGYARYRIVRLMPRLRHAIGPMTAPLAPYWGVRRSTKPWARALEAVLWGDGFRSYQALLSGEFAALGRIAPMETADVLGDLGSGWSSGSRGDLAAARAYDQSIWLPNLYLEKIDRATMAHSLEARVPYLDPVVASVAQRAGPAGNKDFLTRALVQRLPSVQLPERKRGLAINVRALVGAMQPQLQFAFRSRESVLLQWLGGQRTAELSARSERSPDLAYRIAMLASWQQQFSHLSFGCDSHPVHTT